MLPIYYLIGLFFATAVGWTSWLVVINKMSPFLSGNLALTFFYAALFVAVGGTFAILDYYLRITLNKTENFYHHFGVAIRQGCLLSIMICLGLAFQRLRILTWWDMLMLFAIVVLIEYYFTDHE